MVQKLPIHIQAGLAKKSFLFGHLFFNILFFNITNVFCAKKRVGQHAFICPRSQDVDGHWLASFEVIQPPKKFVFPRPENGNSPLKPAVSDIQNFGNFFFWGEILSRRYRLSRISRAPSRLIRPRPIDCDRGLEPTVKALFSVFGFKHQPNKSIFKGPPSISAHLHPKRSP